MFEVIELSIATIGFLVGIWASSRVFWASKPADSLTILTTTTSRVEETNPTRIITVMPNTSGRKSTNITMTRTSATYLQKPTASVRPMKYCCFATVVGLFGRLLEWIDVARNESQQHHSLSVCQAHTALDAFSTALILCTTSYIVRNTIHNWLDSLPHDSRLSSGWLRSLINNSLLIIALCVFSSCIIGAALKICLNQSRFSVVYLAAVGGYLIGMSALAGFSLYRIRSTLLSSQLTIDPIARARHMDKVSGLTKFLLFGIIVGICASGWVFGVSIPSRLTAGTFEEECQSGEGAITTVLMWWVKCITGMVVAARYWNIY